MAKQINIIANLIDKQLKKQIQAIQNGKYNINVNVNSANVGQTSNQVHQLSRSANSANSAFGKLGSTISETFSTSRMTMTAFLAVMNEIRKAGKNAQQTILDLDKAITDLSVAMNGTREEAAEYVKTLNKQAIDLNVTTQTVTNASDAWLRQGKTIKETEMLIKDSLVLSKVGKIESAEATDYLTSALNGYKLEAEDAISVIDKLTSVDAVSASESGGLALSMSRTASAADMAGLSMDKLIGYIATVKEVTRDSDQAVGNMMKTMLSRMNQVKAGKFIDEETGESLNDMEKVLNKVSIAMRDANGQFISSESVLDELGQKFNEFDSVTQRAIATQLGGTYQYEKVIALLSNYSKALEYAKVSANSSGSAMQKFNESYLGSIEAAQAKLQASFESLIINSDFDEVYSGIIDATTALVGFMDKTNALKGIMTGLVASSGIKFFSSVKTGAKEAYLSLNQFSNALKIVKQTNISTGDFDRLLLLSKNLSSSQMKLLLSTKNLTLAQKEQILVNSGLSIEESKLQLQTWGMATAQNGLTVATTSLANAFRGLIASMVANPIILLTTVISGATMAWSKYKQHLEDVRQSAQDAANAMDEQTKSVDDYIARYKELQTALRNAKGDEEATYSVKQDLLALQTELNNAFGDEYGKLNLVTDAYKDQTEAIKAYKKEIAQNFLNENYEGIKNATQKMTKENHYNLSYGGESIYNDKGKILKEIADAYSDSGISVMDESGDGSYTQFSIHLRADAEDAYKTISDFMNDIRDKATALGNEELFADVLEISSKSLNSAKDIIDENGEIFRKALISEIAVDDKLSAGYTEATKAVENYNDAVLRSEDPYSDENVKSAWDNLQTVKQGIEENAEEWGKYESVTSEVFDQANDSAYSFYQTMQKDDSISKLADDLQGISDTDLQSMADDGVEDSFDRLCKKASAYGLEVQDVIDLLLQLGIVQGKIQDSEPDGSGNESAIKSFAQAWEELKVSTEDSTKKLADDLTELAEKCRLTAETFSQADTSGYFASLGISADEAVQKINSMVDSATQLQSMSAQISKMSDMLADKKNGTTATADDLAGFDAEVRGLDSWAEFEKVMGSITSTIEECQYAANALASEWINNGNFLANLTDQNRDYYETQLKNMGIENAHIIVLENLAKAGYELSDAEQAELDKAIQARQEIYALQVAEAQDFIAKKDLKAAAEDAYAGLIKEAEGAGISKAALFDLIYQQNIFSNQKLNIYDKIAALQELGEAFGITADAALGASQAINLKNELRLVKHYGGTDADVEAYYAKIESQYQDAIKSKFANLSTTISPSGSSGYTPPKTKNGSDSKDTKQTIDWISRLLDVLQKKIDATKAKFDNLFTLKDKKNNLAQQITLTKGLLTATTVAADRYKKAADKVSLSKELKAKVKNGSYDITEYGSETSEKIQKYQEYLDQYNELKQQEEELNAEIRGLKSDKYQLDIDNAENNIAKLDAQMNNSSSYKERIKYLKKERDYIKDSYYYQIKQAELNGELVKADELRAKRQKELTDNTIAQYQEKVDNAQSKLGKSQAYAELDAGNYKEQNKHLEAQKKYIEESYNWQIKIAKKKGETLEVDRLRAEKQEELNNLTKQEFDNIANTYDNKIGLTNNKIKAFQDQISLLEARGQTVGSALYTKQMSLNNINAEKLLAEKEKLIAKLADFKKGSDDWYDAQEKLFSIDSELVQIEINNANLQKSINQLKFDHFDVLLNKLNDITSETDFLISMLDSDNFYDDSGKITDDGITAMGLTAQNYDTYLSIADKYKEQIAELNSAYESGSVDLETYNDKMREYQQGQQNAIKSANEAKKAVIDYVRDGLEKQNEALQESINKQKELLSQQKESRDFNKKMLDLDKEIARTERRLQILSGDDSEGNRKTIRELKSKLEDLKQDRDDTLYDKSIEDQQDALDKMLEDAKSATEIYLKDTDRVFIETLNLVNTNTGQVAKNLEKIAKNTGYSISENITNAWKGAGSAVGTYESILQGNVPKVTAQISLITSAWQAAAEAAEKAAKAMVTATTDTYLEHTNVSANTNSSSSSESNTTTSSKKKYSLSDIDEFITKNMKEANNDKKYYAPLNQYIYGKMGGYVLSKENEKKLAEMLGVSLSTDLTGDAGRKEIQKILDALIKKGWKVNQSDIKGYAKGGLIDLNNAIRLSGEDGVALVRNGEYILSKPQTDGFLKLAERAPQLVETLKNMSIPQFNYAQIDRSIPIVNRIPSVVNNNTIDNRVIVEGVATNEIVKDMENVAAKQAEKMITKINNISYTSKNISRR